MVSSAPTYNCSFTSGNRQEESQIDPIECLCLTQVDIEDHSVSFLSCQIFTSKTILAASGLVTSAVNPFQIIYRL